MSQACRLETLSVELEAVQKLAESLESQRDALIERDIGHIEDLSVRLEDGFAQVGDLAVEREAAFRDAPLPSSEELALLRQLRAAEHQVMSLADLNQQIIADRLAYLRVMLDQMHPDGQSAGYAPGKRNGTGETTPRPRGIARSA